MAKDVKLFEQDCLHCVAIIPEDKVPRPLGMQPHVFCRPDQCSLIHSYVDDNSCLISE
jgi:hypothetical protein